MIIVDYPASEVLARVRKALKRPARQPADWPISLRPDDVEALLRAIGARLTNAIKAFAAAKAIGRTGFGCNQI